MKIRNIENPGALRSFLLGGGLAGALAACLTTPLVAQEIESPLSPPGRIRLAVSPVFQSWSARFGSGGGEPLASELTDPTGVALFPEISRLETALRDWLGPSDFGAVLGSSRAEVSASRVRVPMHADIGVLDWLTVGVTVPLVRNRTEVDFAFRADSATANLGVSPAITSAGTVTAFTQELRLRAQAAAGRATQLCAEAPSSPECAAATQTARDGERLLSGFVTSYAASPFYPLATSAVGQALRQRVGSFNQGLTALELPSLSQPPLPTARVTAASLESLLANPAVGINTIPLSDRVGVWELGDVEVQLAFRLIDLERRDSATFAPRFSYQLGGGVLARLGTGREDDPDVFLDLGAGDGQTDLEGRVFSNLRSGRFGLWGDLRYGVQRPRTLVRRVGPPELVLVPAVNRATVEWTPGSYLELELYPRYHFTSELAFTAGYRLRAKGEDDYVRVSPAPEPTDRSPLPSPPLYTDVELLTQETKETSHEVGGGLVFSTLEAWEGGRASRPFELRFNVNWAASGTGRQVPKGVRAVVGMRLYFRLWGS